MLAQLFVILSFAAVGLARTASTNDTDCPINIPGFTHNGDCELFCKPATWKDIIVFYLANYVAHVATVVTEPGESPLTSIISLALVLFFPGAGIVKGALAISSGAVFASTELRQAARAGALCVVVKDEIPETNEIREEPFDLVDHPMNRRPRTPSVDLERHGLTANGLQTLKPRGEQASVFTPKLHGRCKLPQGYRLFRLPRSIKPNFESDPTDKTAKMTLPFRPAPERISVACEYNMVKVAVSAGQLIYTCITLYQARGNQIATFGYASFGLTVAQYAWMSFLNLLGNLLCPQYSTMFLVASSTLDELLEVREREGKTSEYPKEGVVGRITEDTEARLLKLWTEGLKGDSKGHLESTNEAIASLYVGAAPIAIIGGLSRFSSNDSALYQRVWTMMWLVFGFFFGPVVGDLVHQLHIQALSGKKRELKEIKFILICGVIWLAPAVGGFVVVGQMINQYGVCKRMLET